MTDNDQNGHSGDVIYFYIDEFLKEYKKYPCLWDKSHSQFRNRLERIKCEQQLGAKLGIHDILNLRKKIRSIRGMYNTEIRKIKQTLESGEPVYPPKLEWFHLADKFLRVTTDLPYDVFSLEEDNVIMVPRKRTYKSLPKIAKKERYTFVVVEGVKPLKSKEHIQKPTATLQPERTDNSIENCNTTVYLENQDNEELEIEYLEDNIDYVMKNEDLETGQQSEGETKVHKENSVVSQNFLEDHSHQHNEKEDLIEHYEDGDDNMKDTDTCDSTEEGNNRDFKTLLKELTTLVKSTENEFVAFGRSIAVQLQNMPLELALQLQTDIQAHITKCRLEHLSNTN